MDIWFEGVLDTWFEGVLESGFETVVGAAAELPFPELIPLELLA